MNYFIIRDLKIENFYYNSSLYLHKTIEDESARENEKINEKIENNNLILKQNLKFQSIENLINSNISKNKNILRNKIHSIYNSIDDEDMEELNYELEKEKLLDNRIKSDILILLPKSIFSSNQQIDVAKFSLIVNKSDNIFFGNYIDKNILELFDINEEGEHIG